MSGINDPQAFEKDDLSAIVDELFDDAAMLAMFRVRFEQFLREMFYAGTEWKLPVDGKGRALKTEESIQKQRRAVCVHGLRALCGLLDALPVSPRKLLYQPYLHLALALRDYDNGSDPKLLRRTGMAGHAVETSAKFLRNKNVALSAEFLRLAGVTERDVMTQLAAIYCSIGHVTNTGKPVDRRTMQRWSRQADSDAVARALNQFRDAYPDATNADYLSSIRSLAGMALAYP